MSDMTDDARRELAAGLAAVVRAAMAGYGVHSTRPRYVIDQGFSENLYTDRIPDGKDTNTFPPLTTGQLLGLSALLGGEVEARALADWLEEQGTSWVQAVRQAERERVVKLIDSIIPLAQTNTAAVLNVLRVCVSDPEAADRAFREIGERMSAALRPLADAFAEFGRRVYALHNPPT